MYYYHEPLHIMSDITFQYLINKHLCSCHTSIYQHNLNSKF